jgi:hypothetical protein
MSTINQLSAVDTLAYSDSAPLYSSSQGDTRRFSFTTLVSFLSTAFTTFRASSYIASGAVTVANLPSAATAGAGARAFVTDSSTAIFNATITGGGANRVGAISDGSIWKVG